MPAHFFANRVNLLHEQYAAVRKLNEVSFDIKSLKPIFAALKNIIAIFLLLVLSMHLFIKPIIFFSWKINQDYIAKNLCEKRTEKNNCCKGKCQLQKQLNKADQAPVQHEQKIKLSTVDYFVLTSVSLQLNFYSHKSAQKYLIANEDIYPHLFTSYNVKPPDTFIV